MPSFDKSLIWTVACALLALGIAWGRQTYQMSNQENRITALEKQAQRSAVIEGQMKFFLFYGGRVKK
jgi:hypothetical protein